MSADTTPDFAALMAETDAEGTYADMMAQNAALTPEAIAAELTAMAGAPLDTEEIEPVGWRPAKRLSPWARDPGLPDVAEAQLLLAGDSLSGQVRLLPGAPPSLSELDLYIDGRLAAELPATEAMRSELGDWIEVSLSSAPAGPVAAELCHGSQVVASMTLTPGTAAAQTRIDGGFSGLRQNTIALWAVDRADPARPVVITMVWNGTRHRILLGESAPFARADVLATRVPLSAATPGHDHRVSLLAGPDDKPIRRGSFWIRREKDSLFLWRCHRIEGGGLFGTVLAAGIDDKDPVQPVLAGLTPRSLAPASSRDRPAFAFGTGANSFVLDDAALKAAADPKAIRLWFRDASGTEVQTAPFDPADLSEVALPG